MTANQIAFYAAVITIIPVLYIALAVQTDGDWYVRLLAPVKANAGQAFGAV